MFHVQKNMVCDMFRVQRKRVCDMFRVQRRGCLICFVFRGEGV